MGSDAGVAMEWRRRSLGQECVATRGSYRYRWRPSILDKDCVAFFFAAARRGTAFNVGLTTALAANGLPGRRFAVLLSVQLSQLACSLAFRVCVCTVFDDPVRGELSPLQHSFPAPPPFSLTSSFCATPFLEGP